MYAIQAVAAANGISLQAGTFDDGFYDSMFQQSSLLDPLPDEDERREFYDDEDD